MFGDALEQALETGNGSVLQPGGNGPPDATALSRPSMAKLYFYYASMNAGKSTTLLQADFNYRERGMETMLYTAAIDDRAGAA